MNIMLLAAGEGTRLRPHTLSIPKPAIAFLNIPLAFYSLNLAQPIDTLVVNTFHLPQQIHKLFNRFQNEHSGLSAKELFFSNEKEKILGSGGGLKAAEKFFAKSPLQEIVLMNSDEVILPDTGIPWDQILIKHRSKNSLSTLFVMEHPEVGTKFGGIWVDGSDQVVGFGKVKPDSAVKGYHFVGIQILDKKIFKYIPEQQESNILHDALLSGLKQGHHIGLYKLTCNWFETGNEEDFLTATKNCLELLQTNSYLQKLVSKMCPAHELVSNGKALIFKPRSLQLPQTCQIEDFAVIGDGAIIPPDLKIKRAVILPNTALSKVSDQFTFTGILRA